MAGKDGEELVVGANGRMHVGSYDATLPTNATSALGGTWFDLGLINEDGVTFSDEIEKKRVIAWNARRPVRLIPGLATTTAAFNLLQWNTESFIFAMGGGSVDPAAGGGTVYTPDRDADDFRRLIVEWTDTYRYRLLFPRGVVQGSIEIALAQTDESPLPVTFEAMPDESDDTEVEDPFLLYTNNPRFTEGS